MDQGEGVRQVRALEYWQQDEQHQVRKSYIALCLLMAAVQDAILGETEQRFRNLNWSATISYYSMVHSGRLIVFCGLGDYPTRHVELQRLLAGGRVRPNWLRQHRGMVGQQRGGPLAEVTDADLCAGLQDIGLSEPQREIAAFGERLSAASDLRNDSNYEALLVAHEYDHGVVTEAFERLATAMASVARTCLWTAVDAHLCLRRHDQREAIEALASGFFHGQLVPAMRNKVGGNSEASRLLAEIQNRLELDNGAIRDPTLEEHLKMTVFTDKTRLMRNFEARVHGLEALRT